MAMDEMYGGGSGGINYYANPVNVEVANNNNDDEWFYPDEDNAQSWYESLVNNPVQWYGSEPVEIEAEPIDNSSRYDYSGYMEYSTKQETPEVDYDSYTPAKQEAPKQVQTTEQELPDLEVTTVEEPKMGYTWSEVQPARQPEQASVDTAFIKTAQGRTGNNEDETKFYTGNPIRQEEEAPSRSLADRIMSFGTTPAYGESQAQTPIPLQPLLSNMQALQYGTGQAIATGKAVTDYYGGFAQPKIQTPSIPNNPLSAAGAPNLFRGGSYIPVRQTATLAPTRQTPVNLLPEIQAADYGYRNMPNISAQNVAVPTLQPVGQSPVISSPNMPNIQAGYNGYRNTPTIITPDVTQYLPEAQVSQAGYNGPTHYLGAGPQDVEYPSNPLGSVRDRFADASPAALEEPGNPVIERNAPAYHTLGAGPREQLYESQAHPDELQRYSSGPLENPEDFVGGVRDLGEYFRQSLANNPFEQTPAFQEGNYEYEFRYGDPRNIPPDQIASVYQRMTGDSEFAATLQQEYERLKGYGLSDRQISADLARIATRNNAELSAMNKQDTIRSLMNPDGSMRFDLSAALDGTLPDEYAVPNMDKESGRYNEALEYILTPVTEYNADGTIRTDKDGNPIVHYPFNSPAEILHLWEKVNVYDPSAGPIKYTQDGEGFRGIPDDLPDDVKKFLATSPYGSILQSTLPGGSGKPETIKATYEEYMQAVEKFIIAMPALQQLINNNLLTKEDIAKFFFKGLDVKKEEEKTTKKSSGGGGGRGSSSSGSSRRSGGGGGGSSSSTTNPPVANQKMSRIFNIMKNWSF